MNTIIVKVNNKVETVAEHTVVLKDETPTVIKAVNRTNYELLDTTVNRAPNNVVTKRVDKNLHISFENDGQGPDLIIEGFYDNADSALIGIAEDGSYYYYLPDTGDVTDYVTELQMGEAQSQSLAGDSQISPWWVGATEAEGFAALPWLLGLAGVGVAAAALGGGGGDDNDSAPVDTTAPDAPTDIYVGNDDAFINAAEIDDNGKVDVIIGLPDNASVGDIITVNGIKQKLTNDDIENKNVTVKINAPAEGEALDVTASITDAAGNESDELSETVGIVDTIAPGEQEDADPVAPVVALSDDEAGGVSASEFENGVQVNVTLPLGTVAGDTVTLTVTPDGGVPITVDYEVTEDDLDASIGNGVAIVTIQNNIEDGITADGDYSVTAVVTDVAGNSSMTSESVNFTVDTAPPGAPNIAIGNGDALITADEIRDSQVTISIGLPDNASVGDTVTVNGVDQQLTNNDIANSTATVTIDAPLEGQSLQVTASITDVAGNKSTAVTVSATRDTDDAPEAPDGVAIGNGDTFITADEIAGNQVDVIVDLPESSSVGYTVIVNGVEKVLTNDDIEAGNVGVEIPAPEEGAALEVSVKIEDTAGNVSPTVTANAVRDTTAPDTPLAAPVITDNVDGNGDPLDPAETIANQGITNDNTPGVVIPDSELANGTPTLLVDGVVVPATLVGNTLTPNTPLADDTYAISYTITDAAGNVSDASSVTTITVDTIAPGQQDDADQVAPIVALSADEAGGVSASELADGVQTQVTLPTGTVAGDTVTLTVTLPDNSTITVDYELTPADIASNSTNGFAVVTIPNTEEDGITADGDYSVTAVVTDVAGNSSVTSESIDFTVDTIAPGQQDDADQVAPIVALSADEAGGVSASELADGVQTQVTLPTGTVAGDTVTLTVTLPDNSTITVDYELTPADIASNSTNGFAVVTIPNTEEDGITADGDYSVTAVVTDVAGNSSVTSESIDFTVDTIAPGQQDDADQVAPIVALSADEAGGVSASELADGVQTQVTLPTGTVAGDTVTLTVTLPDNSTITVDYELTPADIASNSTNGFAVVTIPNTEEDGITADGDYSVTAVVTDVAGNSSVTSESIDFTVDTNEIIAAADNFVDFQLTATPLETENLTPSDLNKTGFTVVNVGLGPVLNAGVLDDVIANSVILEVGEDQVREVRVQGAALGVQVLSTIDLSLYKLNESTNEWELQEVKEDWVVSYLLGGASQETDFSLDEGEWLFVMSSGEGVSALTNYTLNFLSDTVLDYSQATAVSGSITGNVLDDVDASFGYDELPTNATVTSITSVNGEKPLVEGEETIQGEYGTLTIFSDGSYEYEVDSSFRGPYGSEDSFTYTVTSPDGNSSSADLTIQLNILPVDNQVKIDESLVVDIVPSVVFDTTDSTIVDASGFSIANIGILGPILDAAALSGSGVMQFAVGDNQVRELTFRGDGFSLVGVDVDYDLAVYRQDESTGNFVQVHLEDNWFTAVGPLNLPVLGQGNGSLELQFGEGEYRAVLIAGDGLSVIEGTNLAITSDKLSDYDNPSTFEGSIAGKDATEDTGIVLLKVDDQIMESNGATVVQGEYGSLTINIDGTYDYTVAKPTDAGPDWVPPYGEVESFNLVTKDANGLVAVDTLNIKISTHTAVDDFNNVTVQESNVISTIKYEEEDGLFTSINNPYSKTFTVAEHDAAAPVEVEATASSLNALGSKITITYTLLNTTTNELFTESVEGGTTNASLSSSLPDLPAGDYVLTITTSRGSLQSIDFNATVIHSEDYTSTVVSAVTGSLIDGNDNDQGRDNISTLKVDGKSVFVSDPNQGAESIDIEGLYGTLTVNKNGSYSYLPNGESFGIERFTYETTSVTGDKETATLELNVGKGITASEFADIAVSSAANDSFVMGTGADTLVFDNLNGINGGNGNNGVDTWSDFSAQQGDQIDITGLLDGNQTLGNIGDYLKYESGTLMVDRNGNAEFEAMLEVDANDLDDLLGSINWGAEAGGRVNLIGTNGDDVVDIAYNISDVSLINLGDGVDAINLTGAGQTLSLSDIFQTEVLDIGGTGANALLVQAADIANSGTSDPIYVKGNSDDTVDLGGVGADLSDTDGANSPSVWIDSGTDVTDTNGQVYNVWQLDSNAATQIYIDTDITVI